MFLQVPWQNVSSEDTLTSVVYFFNKGLSGAKIYLHVRKKLTAKPNFLCTVLTVQQKRSSIQRVFSLKFLLQQFLKR